MKLKKYIYVLQFIILLIHDFRKYQNKRVFFKKKKTTLGTIK